jgi:hypothetical protein
MPPLRLDGGLPDARFDQNALGLAVRFLCLFRSRTLRTISRAVTAPPYPVSRAAPMASAANDAAPQAGPGPFQNL